MTEKPTFNCADCKEPFKPTNFVIFNKTAPVNGQTICVKCRQKRAMKARKIKV